MMAISPHRGGVASCGSDVVVVPCGLAVVVPPARGRDCGDIVVGVRRLVPVCTAGVSLVASGID